jgi:hypothetical protein
MTTPASDIPAAQPRRRFAGWGTIAVVSVVIFLACVFVDLTASPNLTSSAGPSALLALMAGIMQVVALLALAPWWAATAAGARVAALRVLACVAATGALVFVLLLFQTRLEPLALLRVQAVVLGAGLLTAGVSAALGAVFRSVRGAAAFTTIAGFAVAAIPFWGNILIRYPDASGWKSFAVAVVAKLSPLCACADAVGYDFFRGDSLYDLSVVSNYPSYRLPAWWLYALLSGAAGVLLLELAAFIRSRRAASSTSPSGGG